MANTEPNWVAVDWGTTNLRLWLLDAQGQILRQRSSDMGMSLLSSDGYEPVLLDLVQDLLIDDQRLTVCVAVWWGQKPAGLKRLIQRSRVPPRTCPALCP